MIKFKAKTATGEIINSSLSPFTFPAGEAHTKREERRKLEPTEIAVVYGSENIHDDLFQLKMWYNTLVATGVYTALVIPYFPGARADRGNPWGADIYAEFVAEMLFNQIILFDPHSEVIVERLNFHKWPETEITAVYPHEILNTRNSKIVLPNCYDGIIAPDKGAVDRAGAVADAFGVPIYTASKERDFETGKLTGFGIEGLPTKGRFLVVDDICDGGGTFMGLAGAVGDKSPKALLDLYVSHGVFSNKALEILPQAYAKVVHTNSYNPMRPLNKDDYDETFRRIDVIRPLLEKVV